MNILCCTCKLQTCWDPKRKWKWMAKGGCSVNRHQSHQTEALKVVERERERGSKSHWRANICWLEYPKLTVQAGILWTVLSLFLWRLEALSPGLFQFSTRRLRSLRDRIRQNRFLLQLNQLGCKSTPLNPGYKLKRPGLQFTWAIPFLTHFRPLISIIIHGEVIFVF